MHVRPADGDDLSSLIRLAREHGGGETSPGTIRDRYDAHSDLFVVADDDGDPVGEAHGRPRRPEEDPTGEAPDAVVLDRIAVVPERRGAGIGRRLLAAFEDRAAERAPRVEVAVAGDVEGFYAACDYEPWAVLVQGAGPDPGEARRRVDAGDRVLGGRRVDGEPWIYVEPSAFDGETTERLVDRLDARSANTLYRKRVR
ncbi:GNAT family N-acetyltransferase [Halobaculum gomorrense]|uniref:N-acetylglutamate synthase, GNAT family n=1 Tax=Halobaculum gomorrense TaxID=43928 RepID=A0A1M5T089_9EURY|nr:GNAT family N-acetyltransferase [Halobaculum gomorrense]SHH44146.1 N-acetylglutamate synthase, GNAT family [Halobaculum gomorrense]